jgi:hypothetical protein
MRLGGWILFGSALGSVLVLATEGCGSSSTSGGSICTYRQQCLSAPSPTTAEVEQCTAQMNDPTCGAQYKDLKECLIYKAQCLQTGQVNTSATNAICSTQNSAYNTCVRTRPPDGGPLDGCRPITCAQRGFNCGEIDDGCGARLLCGTCTAPQLCGGGGQPNRCGCGALNCGPPGTTCGIISACGQTIDCGNNCTAPNWCGGGTQPNTCGCSTQGGFGPRNPTAAAVQSIVVDAGVTNSWSGATSVYASDNSYASVSLSTGATSFYLLATGFGFTLPAAATIAGIQVDVERSATPGIGGLVDNAVYLVKAANIQTAGANKATASAWGAAETTVTYGGQGDLWSNTFTAADVNAVGFGVAFSARNTAGATDSARVDNIRVTVFYSGVSCQ